MPKYNKDRILKGARKRQPLTHKTAMSEFPQTFFPATIKARRASNEICQSLNIHKC